MSVCALWRAELESAAVWVLGTEAGPLEEQQPVLSMAEPSLQPQRLSFNLHTTELKGDSSMGVLFRIYGVFGYPRFSHCEYKILL